MRIFKSMGYIASEHYILSAFSGQLRSDKILSSLGKVPVNIWRRINATLPNDSTLQNMFAVHGQQNIYNAHYPYKDQLAAGMQNIISLATYMDDPHFYTGMIMI